MSLSKNNLERLNTYFKKNKLEKYNIANENKNKDRTDHTNQHKQEDPNQLFYKLIDSSENLSETTQVNHLLRRSEENSINQNFTKNKYLKHLTTEEELYDEFNYLLED